MARVALAMGGTAGLSSSVCGRPCATASQEAVPGKLRQTLLASKQWHTISAIWHSHEKAEPLCFRPGRWLCGPSSLCRMKRPGARSHGAKELSAAIAALRMAASDFHPLSLILHPFITVLVRLFQATSQPGGERLWETPLAQAHQEQATSR